jgi:hypothetical protein
MVRAFAGRVVLKIIIERRMGHTFPICLFHFWTPTLTFTVFSMKPAETTTAFVCRVKEAAIFCTDILLTSIRRVGVDWEMHHFDVESEIGKPEVLSRRFFRSGLCNL